MPFRALALLPVLLVLVGCHSALADAMASYEDARYPTAAAQFRALEPTARRLGARDFASYALHRGLTHLALGDARAAALWLGHAKVSADRDPDIFDAEERGALLAAWRSMGHMPGEPGFGNAGTSRRASAANP
ncbi:MAG TPA: hypothetical protein VNW92_04325 [Polyangiaceae bacterium]|jgi:hypothetical protein|nr:hypothetical protein [Polyangiaceae bacterium]